MQHSVPNDFEGFTAGYQYIRSAFGLKAAHDRMQV